MNSEVLSAAETKKPAQDKHKSYKARKITHKCVNYLFLLLLAFIMLYPIALLVNMSLKTTSDFNANPIGWVDVPDITFKNYETVIERLNFVGMALNSIFYSTVSAAISCVIALLAAYPLSRNHFKGSRIVFTVITVSMFLPGSLIATITLVKDVLHIYGTQLNLIFLWSCSSLQINIFMMVGFIKTLPRDLDDAAWIDGCPYFKYIFVVALPLLMPIVATIFTIRFIGFWNDFLTPFIYLSDPLDRPLATGLYFFQGQYASRWNELSSVIILVALPMVLLYIFMQRFIIEGMTAGALKG